MKDASTGPRLTKEQDEARLQGLRILARMIVRAHLKALAQAGEPDAEGLQPDPSVDSPKDDRDAS